MIVNDSELYNYLLCSKKYEYKIKENNTNWIPNNRLIIFQKLLEKISLENKIDFSKDLINYHFDICKSMGLDFIYHLDNYKKIEDLFNKLKLWNFSLVSGHQSSLYKYGGIQYNINIESLFITNKGALRGVCITPYQFKKDISWNVAHRMQYEFLKDIYIAKGKAPGQTAKMFFVGAGNKGYSLNYIDKNIPQNKWKEEIESISKDLKSKRYWPLSPCSYFTCEYRKICFPGD